MPVSRFAMRSIPFVSPVLAVLICGSIAWGQPTVSVSVKVSDPTGAFIPDATVEVLPRPANDLPLKTNAIGQATTWLVPGDYDFRISAPGFRIASEHVSVTGAATIPVTLEIPWSGGPVYVNATDLPLETEHASLQALIQEPPRTIPGPTYTPVTIVVTDPSGAAIAGAYVKLTPGTTTGENLVTDEHGSLQVGLNPGRYHLRVTAQGYPASEQDVAIQSKPQTITVSLSNGGGSPQVVAVPDTAMAMDVPTAPATSTASANTLIILGVGGERGVFTPATLKDYPHQSVTIFDHHTNANETYSGVPLMDLLAHLGVPHGKELMGKALGDYIVATGSDGYKSVVALGEVDPEFHPGTVLVADTIDGKPLDKAGPFRLVVSEDKRPARSVRNLVRIELKTAE